LKVSIADGSLELMTTMGNVPDRRRTMKDNGTAVVEVVEAAAEEEEEEAPDEAT
jgi:hypothetical protein